MADWLYRLFIGFAAEDRYTIAEPIVYHLKNYGVNTWYDRHALILGDNRRKRNLEEGAGASAYACIIISKNTISSICTMEELSIIKERFIRGDVTVFPVLYELSPDVLPSELQWVKEIIFKEVDRHSGTKEICNHIVCKISTDMLTNSQYKHISDIIAISPATPAFMSVTNAILFSYQKVDHANLNSRIALLYAAYLSIIHSAVLPNSPVMNLTQHIFDRLFSETQLNLPVDYRELWLLENAICILVNYCMEANTESSI